MRNPVPNIIIITSSRQKNYFNSLDSSDELMGDKVVTQLAHIDFLFGS